MSDAIRKFLDLAAEHVGQPYEWAHAGDVDVQPLIDWHRRTFGDARMEGAAGGGAGGAGEGGGQGGQGGTGAAGEGGNAYTPPASQAEFDAVIRDRLARERAKYSNYDEYKAAADELQKLKDGQKSDLERITAERDDAAKKAEAAQAQVKQTLRHAAVIAEAAKQGAVDPQAAAVLLPADAVTVADDGTVTGAEAAVKALLEEKKYLKGEQGSGTGRGGPPNHGQGRREGGGEERGAAGRAEAAKRFGDKSGKQQ